MQENSSSFQSPTGNMKIHFFPVCLIVAVFGDELAADAYRVVNSAELISLYDENDAVIELTNKNITQVLMNPTQVWYIEFYMHWCGHCQKFSPLWKELANQFDGKEKIIPRYFPCHRRKMLHMQQKIPESSHYVFQVQSLEPT